MLKVPLNANHSSSTCWSCCAAQLDYKVNAEKLEEIFRIAGNVLNVELKMDKDTNKFRGMATVRFEHPIESVQAICILLLSSAAYLQHFSFSHSDNDKTVVCESVQEKVHFRACI